MRVGQHEAVCPVCGNRIPVKFVKTLRREAKRYRVGGRTIVGWPLANAIDDGPMVTSRILPHMKTRLYTLNLYKFAEHKKEGRIFHSRCTGSGQTVRLGFDRKKGRGKMIHISTLP